MAYRVLEVRRRDADRLADVLRRDDVSRQSITVKEARAMGLERDTLFVHLEGDEDVLDRAEAVILDFGRRTKLADAVHAGIKREEERAAGSLGFVFGAEG